MTEPDELARAREELGEPDALFQVSPGWFRTKFVIAVLLIGVGVGALGLGWLVGWRGFHAFAHAIFWPIGTGIALLVNLYRQRGLYVLVYPTGLLRLRRGEVESFPWDEVAEVRLKTQKTDCANHLLNERGEPIACWLPAEVPDVQVWNAGLTVVRADGTKAEFGPVLAGYAELAAEVQQRSFPPLWADALRRFRDGLMLPFGPLEVSLAGVHHKGQLLRWADVGKVSIANGQLVVGQKGKWLPFAAVRPAADVPNLHVLFALVAFSAGGGAEPEPES
jgi:hypothetical protein